MSPLQLPILLLLLAGPGGATAQVLGIPCDPGTASANGFKPCTACPPGTFAAFDGATTCATCPLRSYTAHSGSVICSTCECDDEIACTVDSCNAVTGACAVEPVPTCTPVTLGFAGTIADAFSPQGELPFATGGPITGSFVIDPLAPDAAPTDPGRGSYPGAILAFTIRAGTTGAPIRATATGGRITVWNGDPFLGDVVEFVVPEPIGAGVDPLAAEFRLEMSSDDPSFLASVALPVAPIALPGLGAQELRFFLAGDYAAFSTDFALLVPEPAAHVGAVGVLTAFGAIFARRRRKIAVAIRRDRR